MKVFHIKDKVKLSSELLRYSANKNWIGKIGEILEVLGQNTYLVKWEHLDNPIMQEADFMEYV